MSRDWQAFLESRGARFSPAGGVEHFSEARDEAQAALTGDIVADLSPLQLIVATGADVARLFQGQFTNDIEAITEAQCQLSAYCNTKGRVFAFFRVLRRDSEYWLEVPASLRDTFLSRLKRYVLRADVQLRSGDDSRVALGLSGGQAFAALREICTDLPESVHEVRVADELTFVRVPGPHPRLHVYGPPARARALWERLEQVARPVGFGAWALLDIRTGLPSIGIETSEHFLPQMLNLQVFEALSYSKGCYIGQEVVARTHYLGSVKRRLFRMRADARMRPAPGDQLIRSAGDTVGAVIAAEPDADGRWEMLAVVSRAAACGPLRLERDPDATVRLASLPYVLEETPVSDTSG